MGKKTKTKKEEAKVAEPDKRTKMPEPYAENIIDVQFGKKDLADLINLLSMTAQTYEILAKDSLRENNEKAFDILTTRMRLSQDYANKLAAIHGMGEAPSRDLH